MGITAVQRGEVLRDRISLTRGAGLPAGQLHGTGEVRKPRHRNTLPLQRALPRRLPSLPSGNILIPSAARRKAPHRQRKPPLAPERAENRTATGCAPNALGCMEASRRREEISVLPGQTQGLTSSW